MSATTAIAPETLRTAIAFLRLSRQEIAQSRSNVVDRREHESRPVLRSEDEAEDCDREQPERNHSEDGIVRQCLGEKCASIAGETDAGRTQDADQSPHRDVFVPR